MCPSARVEEQGTVKSEPIPEGKIKTKLKGQWSSYPVFGLLLHGETLSFPEFSPCSDTLWSKTQICFSLSSQVISSSKKRRASGGQYMRLFRQL